ncbi:transporter [Cupriavidus sp. BIC8F]|uniref:transporter n=1 Tax=Cupriavidus sp. BIC8F TaxID=3079014 RepID=UPI002916AA31|nr:transporter [Cupriavidus sp. BIC8F]
MFVLLHCWVVADAQELEARAYSAAPTGTNFLLANYARQTGQALTDPSLPISDIRARFNLFGIGYARVFDFVGRSASIGLFVPFADGDVAGKVFDAPNQVHRAGLGDIRLRLAVDLVGGPAMTREEFAQRTPGTIVGASLQVIAPTGQYDPARLINLGTNRWAIKPEIGVSHPIGNWFVEVDAGVWFYSDNDAFLRSHRRSQAPLAALQLHGGYDFRPGLWIAADLGYFFGGETAVDSSTNGDRQQNSRYGVTLSLPLAGGWSAKLAASKGLSTRFGGAYKAVSLTIQYRWFDH